MKHHAWLFALAAALALDAAGTMEGQDTARVIPTSLARTLAEAARDFPTGLPVFLVARVPFPQRVVAGFPTRAQAQFLATRLGTEFEVFGPFRTPLDTFNLAPAGIDSVLVFPRESGQPVKLTFAALCSVDALFFSRAAMIKFMAPYYFDRYGLRVTDSLMERVGKTSCHCQGTVPCWPPLTN